MSDLISSPFQPVTLKAQMKNLRCKQMESLARLIRDKVRLCPTRVLNWATSTSFQLYEWLWRF